MKISVLIVSLLFCLPSWARTGSTHDYFNEMKGPISKEFGSDPALKAAMSYVIYSEILRIDDPNPAQRIPMFLRDSVSPATTPSRILERLSSVTKAPHAMIEVAKLAARDFDYTTLIRHLDKMIFNAIPEDGSRIHLGFDLSNEQKLTPEYRLLLNRMLAIFQARKISVDGKVKGLEHVDLLLFPTVKPAIEDPSLTPLMKRFRRNGFPQKFLNAVTEFFPIVDGPCTLNLLEAAE